MANHDTESAGQLLDVRAVGLANIQADQTAASTTSTIQTGYKIVLYHDGNSCVAELPELPGCIARGDDYFEVLKRIQQKISSWIAGRPEQGPATPKKILNTLHCFSPRSKQQSRTKRRSMPIKARLIDKFGKRSNRELAACIGIVSADAPIMLSSAMAGNGTRKVRCAIAMALDEPPSGLWPARDGNLNRSDDAFYHSSIQAQTGFRNCR